VRRIKCRRWGEAVSEKDTVYLFPAEPTDEELCSEETLNPGLKEPPAFGGTFP